MRFVPRRLIATRDASRGDTSLAGFVKNSLGVILTLALAYLALGLLADLVASTLPETWEARIFAGPAEGEIPPTAEFERAQVIFDRLLRSDRLRPLPYRLFQVDLGGPNAVALPGGAVGITPELLEHVHTETGLAVVLGHELGHHQGRHALQKMGRGILIGTVRSLLFGGDTNRLLKASVSLAESGHSRRQENDADAFGLRLVHDMYGQAPDATEFYDLILEEDERGRSTWQRFLASHPLTTKRIQRLRELRERLDRGEP